MTKRKVCVVVTARPTYSRIKTALKEIQNNPDLELQLVVGASALLERYGNVVALIEKDGFVVAEKVYTILEGSNISTMAKSTGLGLMELATVFDNLKPDIVVTVADRFETLSTAVAAAYMNIPLIHIQGGEITGSIDEKVRHAITKLADFHFVSTTKAAERVIKMGEYPQRVFVTGCPSIDIAEEIRTNNHLDFSPYEEYSAVGAKADYSKGYLVVLQHPVTTSFELAREQIAKTLQAVHNVGLPTFWFWPNVDAGTDGTSKGIRSFRESTANSTISFVKNMEGRDFLKLLYNSRCLIGNSSVGIRECSFLGIPVVNIGDRQAGRERGPNVVDVDYNQNDIESAIKCLFKENKRMEQSHIYGDGKAGKKIAQLLGTLPLTIEKRLAY